MPVFQLTDELAFPPTEYAEPDGLLAIGGDLSVKRLVLAYSLGIFPWYSEGDPILWWSPDPRMIMIPAEFTPSRSLKRCIGRGHLTVTMDRAFDDVVIACATTPRDGQHGTWITTEMRQAYGRLHRAGLAHSVETWQAGKLVGGLYGIALGGCFFGESMFSHASNASKVAFAALARFLEKNNYDLIDCQMSTDHLVSLGGREIPRLGFLAALRRALAKPTTQSHWK